MRGNEYVNMQLNNIRKGFDEYLSQLDYSEPHSLYDPIQYSLEQGGKRVRAILSILSFLNYNQDIKKAYPLAAAMEIFHNFSLLHDDIMDDAPTRRGQASVFAKFGQNTAILSGDRMLIMAYQQLALVQKLENILPDFNTMASLVCEGQQMDMDFEHQMQVPKDDYLKMIRFKTSELIGYAMKLAAISAGATTADSRAMYNCGINLGLAFQIQDDILDVFGAEQVTGKQKGGDILQAKKTILYILFQETLKSQADREQFRILYESNTSDKVQQVISLWKAEQVEKKATALKIQYETKAYDSLQSITMGSQISAGFTYFFEALSNRTH